MNARASIPATSSARKRRSTACISGARDGARSDEFYDAADIHEVLRWIDANADGREVEALVVVDGCDVAELLGSTGAFPDRAAPSRAGSTTVKRRDAASGSRAFKHLFECGELGCNRRERPDGRACVVKFRRLKNRHRDEAPRPFATTRAGTRRPSCRLVRISECMIKNPRRSVPHECESLPGHVASRFATNPAQRPGSQAARRPLPLAASWPHWIGTHGRRRRAGRL